MTTDSFTITISGTRDDPESEPVDDMALAAAETFAVQALVDAGWPRESITYSHEIDDGSAGSGDGTDFVEVELPGPPS